MGRTVGLIDTTLRDGSQCLWATRMTTAMMLPILPLMDEAGFHSIETFSTVHFDTAVGYLREDPWERMRLIRQRIRKTPLRILGMSQYFSISSVLPDDVVELFIRTCARNGIDQFWITASMNDTRTSEVSIRTVQALGLHVEGGIQFADSPVHTDEFFANVVREFVALGVHGIVIKDGCSLLTPERARTLVPAVIALDLLHASPGLGPEGRGTDAAGRPAAPQPNRRRRAPGGRRRQDPVIQLDPARRLRWLDA
jgi:pyruvate/oxaloacetate carboxyltransferase